MSCHIVAVKFYNNEPIDYLISGNISIAVFQKIKDRKWLEKWKALSMKEILKKKRLEMIKISDAEEGSKLIRQPLFKKYRG